MDDGDDAANGDNDSEADSDASTAPPPRSSTRRSHQLPESEESEADDNAGMTPSRTSDSANNESSLSPPPCSRSITPSVLSRATTPPATDTSVPPAVVMTMEEFMAEAQRRGFTLAGTYRSFQLLLFHLSLNY